MPYEVDVPHIPLEPTEVVDLSSDRPKKRFVTELSSRLVGAMGFRKQDAHIISYALCDFLQEIITENNSIYIPSIGRFRKLNHKNIRFYPCDELRKKFVVTSDNGPEEGARRFNRKLKKTKKKKKIIG